VLSNGRPACSAAPPPPIHLPNSRDDHWP
jgi:hypothetical protein